MRLDSAQESSGGLLHFIKDSAINLLLAGRVGIAQAENTHLLLELNDVGLQVFALVAKVAKLTGKPFRSLSAGCGASLEIEFDQALDEVVDDLARQCWIHRSIRNADEPGARLGFDFQVAAKDFLGPALALPVR